MRGRVEHDETTRKWKLMIEGSAADSPALAEVNSFLVDINRAYEFARIAAGPNFDGSLPEIWHRQLRADEILRIKKLHVGSPVNAEFWFLGSAQAVLAVEWVYNRMLSDALLRENLKTARLTNRRFEREEARELGSLPPVPEANERISRAASSPAGRYLERIVARRGRDRIHLTDARIKPYSSQVEATGRAVSEPSAEAGSRTSHGLHEPPAKE